MGWAAAEHLKTDLVDAALTDALRRRRPADGLVFHSDRGCQCTSAQHARLAKQHGVPLSVGRRGQCWDNAVPNDYLGTAGTGTSVGSSTGIRRRIRIGGSVKPVVTADRLSVSHVGSDS